MPWARRRCGQPARCARSSLSPLGTRRRSRRVRGSGWRSKRGGRSTVPPLDVLVIVTPGRARVAQGLENVLGDALESVGLPRGEGDLQLLALGVVLGERQRGGLEAGGELGHRSAPPGANSIHGSTAPHQKTALAISAPRKYLPSFSRDVSSRYDIISTTLSKVASGGDTSASKIPATNSRFILTSSIS